VESQEWLTPGGPRVMAPNIVAVATLLKYSDAQRTETREAVAYNLLPEHKIFDWQIGYGGGGLTSGIGLIAIPSLLADLDATGVTSELAIANVVPKPGFTDFVIYIYDQNGLLDYICQKLNEKQVEYIDLQTWGYINRGFKGSAIISAFFWEHDVFASDGRFLRNLVGLGAVAIERSKTSLGKDIPGDEAAGDRGIPFRRSDVKDAEFDFTFLGELPSCPGLPDNRPKQGECTPTGINQEVTLDIAVGPPFAQLPFGTPCASGGVNDRNFGQQEFSVCKAGSYQIEIISVTLAPYSGASCGTPGADIYVMFFFGPEGFDPTNQCNNFIVKVPSSGRFVTTGPGKTELFDLPEGPRAYTVVMQNDCDTTPPQSSGPVVYVISLQ